MLLLLPLFALGVTVGRADCSRKVGVGAGMEVTNIKVGSSKTCTSEITIKKGDSLYFEGTWHNTETHCPGCIEQFQFGLDGSQLQCLFSRNPWRDETGNFSKTFGPFNSVGTYKIVALGDWQYSCVRRTSGATVVTVTVTEDGSDCNRKVGVGAGMEVSKIKVAVSGETKQCTNEITIKLGETVSFEAEWHNTEKHCPGCIEQLHFGIAGETLQCLWSKNPYYDERDTYRKTFSFDRIGEYKIVARGDWQYSCVTRNSGTDLVKVKVVEDCSRVVGVGAGMQVENIKLDGQCQAQIAVETGGSVQFSARWHNTETHCPGCIEQLHFGINGQTLQCLWSRNPYRDESDNYSKTFTFNQEGVFKIVALGDWQYSCVTRTSGYELATVLVVGSPCKDKSDNNIYARYCQSWANSGYCTQYYVNWMKTYCAKTCCEKENA